jgi:hypothetical protein
LAIGFALRGHYSQISTRETYRHGRTLNALLDRIREEGRKTKMTYMELVGVRAQPRRKRKTRGRSQGGR